MQEIPLRAIRITDPTFAQTQALISTVMLPYQWAVLNNRVQDAEPSYGMENFRVAAGDAKGTHHGAVFQDSDVYKWIEAVAYSLTLRPDAALEADADEAIRIIARAQQPDGYLNTYYTLLEPQARFRNLTEGHELYCAGHLFEAAVAYREATGKDALLNVAIRFADCLVRHFLPGDGLLHGYPGHPEVELALVRLYGATGNADYLRLCECFLSARGQGESWREREKAAGGFQHRWGDDLFAMPDSYQQAHQPVRAQREAAGHAVRAMYLYSAMADVARITKDAALEEACRALLKDVTRRQMYVTGGIGATVHGESFTTAWDLPSDSAYCETCASVGLTMFARRMWRLTGEGRCMDIWERALRNTVLAGMGRDGQHFFYVNPLAVTPRINHVNKRLAHVKTQRPRWFGVACCPPNLARCVLSMGASLYARSSGQLALLSHIENELTLDDLKASLRKTADGYTLSLNAPPLTLRIRKPDGYTLSVPGAVDAGDFAEIKHPGGAATYAYTLLAQTRILYADPRIADATGKVCVMRGQTVYCAEEADNGPDLACLALKTDASFEAVSMDWLPAGLCALQTKGVRLDAEDWDEAYAPHAPRATPVTITLVPYSQWNNRGEGEMRVWLARHCPTE